MNYIQCMSYGHEGYLAQNWVEPSPKLTPKPGGMWRADTPNANKDGRGKILGATLVVMLLRPCSKLPTCLPACLSICLFVRVLLPLTSSPNSSPLNSSPRYLHLP